MENVLQKPDVDEKDVAISELQSLVEKCTYEKPEEWKVEEDYPQVLKAIQKGLVVIDKDKNPVFTLAFPIGEKGGTLNVTEIKFRTRIKPSDLSNITKGLNVAKQQVEYTLRCLAYITGEPKAMLDKFDKFDYKVIEQISTVFF